MNYEKTPNYPYNKVLNSFLNEPENLIVQGENTSLERIKHVPSGYYFFTDRDGAILAFHHLDKPSVDCGGLRFFVQLITRPNNRIVRNFIEYRSEH